MSLALFLFLLVTAAAAGALGSALGMAGGIFVVPILTLAASASFSEAVAVSLVSVIACSCASSPRFLETGLTNLRLAVVLEVATATGALVGFLLIGAVSDRLLHAVFALVLIISAVQMQLGRRARAPLPADRIGERLELASSYVETDGSTVSYEVARVRTGFSLMFGAGVLSALLGIGSGVLKIPAMDTALRLPIKVSSATARLTIGVTACGTAAAHLLAGNVDLDLVSPVVLGSVGGSILGARILVRIAGPALRLLFMAVLLVLAVPMVMNAFGADLGGLR